MIAFGVRRHVAALKVQTCLRTPKDHSSITAVTSTFTHRHVALGLISESTQRLRPKRDVGDIFAREFLLTLTSRPATGARNRSSQDRPQSLLGSAMRRRT